MPVYLDTSCLLKVFFDERETGRTIELISAESEVVVSSLARLEALVQVQARVAARMLTAAAGTRLAERIETVLRDEPYSLVAMPGAASEAAERQIRSFGRTVHCRTLDRLHLGAMEVLGLRDLLTNDQTQARAARALGFSVTMPR
jgi:uncharacterized protein with PIN domain